METRPLGRTGLNVSVLGLGGAEIGYDRVPQATVDRLLGCALDVGVTVIDTAAAYVDSEAKLGAALAAGGASRRQRFHLCTKCGPDWTPAALARDIDRSLARLRTDYLDLIQLWSCPEATLRRDAVIAVLERARDAGKARAIGYSGDGAAAAYAVATGRFDTLQTSLNLADQEALERTIPDAREHGMGVIAKRPLANVAWRPHAPEAGHTPTYWDRQGYNDAYVERLGRLGYAFLDGPLGAAVSIALRFVLATEGVATAIVGTTKPERLRENAALLAAGPLAAEQVRAIRARWHEVATPAWVGQE